MEDDGFIPDDENDGFVPDAPAMQGKIDKPENFLQRAIKNSGAFIQDPVGQSIKISDGFGRGFGDANYLGVPALTRWAGDKTAQAVYPASPEVKNRVDEKMKSNPLAYGMGAALPVGKGIYDLGKLGVRGINSFRTSPIKKNIKSIEDLITNTDQSIDDMSGRIAKAESAKPKLNKFNQRQASKTAHKESVNVKNKVGSKFELAAENYKSELSNIDHTKIGIDDFIEAIDKTLAKKGATGATYSSSNELALRQVRDRLASMGTKATEEIAEEMIDSLTNQVTKRIIQEAAPARFPKLTRPNELKYFQDEIYRATSGRPDLQGEFLHNFGEMAASKGAGGLERANAAYKAAYETSKEAKLLARPKLQAVAKGSTNVTPEDINLMKSADAKAGTSATKAVEAEFSTAGKRLNKLEQFIKRSTDRKENLRSQNYANAKNLQNAKEDLTKALGRRNWAIGAGTAAAGIPILSGLFKSIFGRKD